MMVHHILAQLVGMGHSVWLSNTACKRVLLRGLQPQSGWICLVSPTLSGLSQHYGNYAQTVAYLAIVRALYRQLEAEEAWRKLINGIREEFRRLPALQDELNKAKL